MSNSDRPPYPGASGRPWCCDMPVSPSCTSMTSPPAASNVGCAWVSSSCLSLLVTIVVTSSVRHRHSNARRPHRHSNARRPHHDAARRERITRVQRPSSPEPNVTANPALGPAPEYSRSIAAALAMPQTPTRGAPDALDPDLDTAHRAPTDLNGRKDFRRNDPPPRIRHAPLPTQTRRLSRANLRRDLRPCCRHQDGRTPGTMRPGRIALIMFGARRAGRLGAHRRRSVRHVGARHPARCQRLLHHRCRTAGHHHVRAGQRPRDAGRARSRPRLAARLGRPGHRTPPGRGRGGHAGLRRCRAGGRGRSPAGRYPHTVVTDIDFDPFDPVRRRPDRRRRRAGAAGGPELLGGVGLGRRRADGDVEPRGRQLGRRR